MRFHLLGALVAASLCAGHAQAGAVGTLIPASNAKDMAYDEQRGIVYVTNGGQVLRYDVGTGKFLAPIKVGGSLMGLDLSPDESTLAIADQFHNGSRLRLHLVDADTAVDNLQIFNGMSFEAGTFAVAYGANGDLLETESFDGSSWVPMRRLQASTGQWTIVRSPEQNTTLSTSGDGSIITFAEANSSGGEWGTYNVATGHFGPGLGTQGFNYDVGTNANGSQFYVQFSGGAQVFNAARQNVVRWEGTETGFPVGGAYHPVKALAYFPWVNTSEVRIFDMTTATQKGTLDFGTVFNDPGDFAFRTFNPGHTRVSRDGSLLMVNVGNGVRIFRMYAPLAATDVSASAVGGKPVDIPVSASLGISGAFTFGVPVKPAHGTVTVAGNMVTYTPDFNFSGTETFTYQAHYSRAVANAKITVQVTPSVNHSPVAADDTLLLNQAPAPVLLDVLANDSDQDGQVLSIISATQPKQGAVAIQGNKILFTPASASARNAGFSYTISDGFGGTATANVHVAFVSTGN